MLQLTIPAFAAVKTSKSGQGECSRQTQVNNFIPAQAGTNAETQAGPAGKEGA